MDEAREFYEHFSLVVGQRDWLRPNLRHARLRRLVDEEIEGSGLRVLDVGCGAGVMTSHMTRYGEVIGTDFSSSAIELARKLVPTATFNAGREIPEGEFDVITLFDVLEHIPQPERPAFIGGLAQRLAPQGRLFVSTPYPAFTRDRRLKGDDTLQIVDEEVELSDVVAEAASAGLRLIAYRAYDVFAGSPEYQALVFMPEQPLGHGRPVVLGDGAYSRLGPIVWRLRQAGKAAARRDYATARWLLTARPPDFRS
jgi:SAM-dependent methyltransferase